MAERGTPFAKYYPGEQRNIWDRFDRLPREYREMVANDPNGHSLATIEAAEELAREAGLLPPLTEKEQDKKELRKQKDRERTKAAKARAHVVYRLPPAPAGTKKTLPRTRKVVVIEKKVNAPPLSKFEHNGKST